MYFSILNLNDSTQRSIKLGLIITKLSAEQARVSRKTRKSSFKKRLFLTIFLGDYFQLVESVSQSVGNEASKMFFVFLLLC